MRKNEPIMFLQIEGTVYSQRDWLQGIDRMIMGSLGSFTFTVTLRRVGLRM
jgi:hypothetical protein